MQEDGHSGPREGVCDPGGAPQHPLHTVDFLWSLGKARIMYATHSITVSKTPEITSWVTFGISVELLMKKVSDAIWKLKTKKKTWSVSVEDIEVALRYVHQPTHPSFIIRVWR